MAKAKSESASEPKSNPELILDIVKKLGRDGVSEGAVRDSLKRDHKDVTLSDSTLKQYVYAARKELGWVKTRGAGSGKSGGEPTVTDLMHARKLAEDVGLTPVKLLELVGKLSRFGDLATLTSCLEALIELSE